MGEKRWEHYPHEADMGVRGVGNSPEEAFEQAALALIAVMVDPQTVRPQQMVELSCEAPDREMLLVDWLNALIYQVITRNMLFSRFEVHLAGTSIQASAWGESIDVARHQPAVEVKGATYTDLAVYRNAEGMWVAQCVVDV